MSYHYRQLGIKTQKVVIDAGMSCPNKDGTKGTGGCIFCEGGSGYFTLAPTVPITEQIKAEAERICRKYPDARLIGYFQSNTNTYCSDECLYEILDEAVKSGLLSFLAIGTRPDCLDDGKIEIIKHFNSVLPVTVELGLQSANDETARKINRGYDFTEFLTAFNKLKSNSIRTCVHLIDGLPGETADDMIRTAEIIGKLKPDALKIHLLFVIRDTKMAELYLDGNYTPLEFDEYIDILIRQLEKIPAETVIERVTGDGDKSKLLAPVWSKDKIRVLGTIDKEFAGRNTWQGRLYLAE
ncbi:MAG: TIGR01212 family radical SAM protein [Clostridia bacterium]|nr:TIGR01212 family radical SAM protein [Clostridia bacterium]